MTNVAPIINLETLNHGNISFILLYKFNYISMTFKDLLSNLGMIIAGFPVSTQACPLIQLLFYSTADLHVMIRELRIQACTRSVKLLGNIVGAS